MWMDFSIFLLSTGLHILRVRQIGWFVYHDGNYGSGDGATAVFYQPRRFCANEKPELRKDNSEHSVCKWCERDRLLQCCSQSVVIFCSAVASYSGLLSERFYAVVFVLVSGVVFCSVLLPAATFCSGILSSLLG